MHLWATFEGDSLESCRKATVRVRFGFRKNIRRSPTCPVVRAGYGKTSVLGSGI